MLSGMWIKLIIFGTLTIAAMVYIVWATQRKRAQIRREMLEVLRGAVPGLEVLSESASEVHVRWAGGPDDCSLVLDKLYAAVDKLPQGTPERSAQIGAYVAGLLAIGQAAPGVGPEVEGIAPALPAAAGTPATPVVAANAVAASAAAGTAAVSASTETAAQGGRVLDRERVFPRLVTSEWLADATARTKGNTPLSLPLGDTGLHVAFVVDQGESVRYLAPAEAAKQGLEVKELFTLSRKNLLRQSNMRASLEQVVRDGSIVHVAENDTYDAARLLLVPAYLPEGTEVLAAVPDRDCLILVPSTLDPDKLTDLVKDYPGERKLLDKPLRVSRKGLALAVSGT